jgi:hypothetical protein
LAMVHKEIHLVAIVFDIPLENRRVSAGDSHLKAVDTLARACGEFANRF